MPPFIRRSLPDATDAAAKGDFLAARHMLKEEEQKLLPTRFAALPERAPLRRRCDGCGLSKSAFHSTDEFDTHRAICEGGRLP